MAVLFQPSTFFTEQLTAFEVWLDHGSEHKKPPEQLPIVLQVPHMSWSLLTLEPLCWFLIPVLCKLLFSLIRTLLFELCLLQTLFQFG